jgi:cytoskeletal protein CcmA (bactofilin family)
MTDVHINAVDEDTLDTVLAPDVAFEGRIEFDKPLMVKGRLSGKVVSKSDFYVDEKAVVEADIEAVNVSVRGTVRGNIVASARVELAATSVLDGDVTAPEVTMETGCRFTGICTTTAKKPLDGPGA